MVFKHQSANTIQCCPDRRDLYQHVRTRGILFHHALDRAHMTFDACQSFDDALTLLVGM